MNIDPLNIPSPAKEIADAVLRAFVDAKQRMRIDEVGLTFTWPSKNPNVSEPFVLKCNRFDDEPSVYWFHGYMYDFPKMAYGSLDDQVQEIVEFLELFFMEEIGCGICFKNGKAVGGGPIWFQRGVSDASWCREPGCVLRSWRGTKDFG